MWLLAGVQAIAWAGIIPMALDVLGDGGVVVLGHTQGARADWAHAGLRLSAPAGPAAAGAVNVGGCRDFQALQPVQKGRDLLHAFSPLRARQVQCVAELCQQAALFTKPV